MVIKQWEKREIKQGLFVPSYLRTGLGEEDKHHVVMSVRGGGLMRPPPLTRPASFMWVSGLLAPKLVAIVQRLLTRCGGRRTQDASTAVLGARSVSDSSEVWLRNRGARIFGTRK